MHGGKGQVRLGSSGGLPSEKVPDPAVDHSRRADWAAPPNLGQPCGLGSKLPRPKGAMRRTNQKISESEIIGHEIIHTVSVIHTGQKKLMSPWLNGHFRVVVFIPLWLLEEI